MEIYPMKTYRLMLINWTGRFVNIKDLTPGPPQPAGLVPVESRPGTDGPALVLQLSSEHSERAVSNRFLDDLSISKIDLTPWAEQRVPQVEV
jgi:hypothetical protein